MRRTRRNTIYVMCALILVYSTLVFVDREILVPGSLYSTVLHSEVRKEAISTWRNSSRNGSWFMDYRVIHEPKFFREVRPVLIMVTSSPKNFDARIAIRKTWGSWPHVRVLYLLGVPAKYSAQLQRRISNEVTTYDDIVQMDFVDSYKNLTMKSCALVMWAKRNSWPERKLVVKVDDDICVDVPLLSSVLGDLKNGVYGEYVKGAKVPRCVKNEACSKFALTRKEYPKSTFPPYVLGAFYMIEEMALRKLHNHLFVPPFLFIEDVYLTGLVSQSANVSVHPMPKGLKVNWRVPSKNWLRQKKLVAQHWCQAKRQREFWKNRVIKTSKTSTASSRMSTSFSESLEMR